MSSRVGRSVCIQVSDGDLDRRVKKTVDMRHSPSACTIAARSRSGHMDAVLYYGVKIDYILQGSLRYPEGCCRAMASMARLRTQCSSFNICTQGAQYLSA